MRAFECHGSTVNITCDRICCKEILMKPQQEASSPEAMEAAWPCSQDGRDLITRNLLSITGIIANPRHLWAHVYGSGQIVLSLEHVTLHYEAAWEGFTLYAWQQPSPVQDCSIWQPSGLTVLTQRWENYQEEIREWRRGKRKAVRQPISLKQHNICYFQARITRSLAFLTVLQSWCFDMVEPSLC